MNALIRGSALDGDPAIYDRTAVLMTELRDQFAREWRALQELRGQRGDEDRAASRGLEIQLRRLCEDYLLSVLSARGFLPGHGFPTGVVSFVCRMDVPEPGNGMGDGTWFNRFPQRQLDVAIREYAPGAEVVIDGLVHRSAGVTLNWRRPASADGLREIQSLLWRWHCPTCGESGSDQTKSLPFCVSCGSAAISWQQYLQPAGFAADLRKNPHADPDEISYIPPRAPAVSARGASWTALPDPIDGRRRATRNGTVYFANAGQGQIGYTICLACGRARDSAAIEEEQPGDTPGGWTHEPLLGKADSSGTCPGAHQPFSLKDNLWLGHEILTDVFELQVTDVGTRGAYLALGVALREALARRLSVEPESMGVAVAPRAGAIGAGFSVYLFDRAVGGAGFAIQADALLLEILPESAQILDCTVPGCETGCPACVLTGDLSEDDAARLDRKAALEGARRLCRSAAPRPEDAVHPTAIVVPDALDAINRDSTAAERVVLRLAAALDPGELVAWRAGPWVRQSGRCIVVSVPTGTISGLDGAARLALRDRLSEWGAALEEAADVVLANGARVIAEVVQRGRSCILATRDDAAFLGDSSWARPTTAPIVRFEQTVAILTGESIPLSRLVPAPGAIVREVGSECDGSLRGFGSRMAKLIGAAMTEAGAPTVAEIAELSYSDRYLASPLVVRLAVDTLAQLVKPQPATPLPLNLRVAPLRGNDFMPTRFDQDWKFDHDRRLVLERYCRSAGLNLALDDRPGAAHGRLLKIRYRNGMAVDLYLDQGFGNWKPTRRTAFDFGVAATGQATQLTQLDTVLTSSGKSYLAIKVHSIAHGRT